MLNIENIRFEKLYIFAVSEENTAPFNAWRDGNPDVKFQAGTGHVDGQTEAVYLTGQLGIGIVALLGFIDDQEYLIRLDGQAPSMAGRRPVEKLYRNGAIVPLGCLTAVNEPEAVANGAWSRFEGEDGKDVYYVAKSDEGTAGCATVAPTPSVSADNVAFACGWNVEAYDDQFKPVKDADVASTQPVADKPAFHCGGAPVEPVTDDQPVNRDADTAGDFGSLQGGDQEIDLLEALTGVFGKPRQIGEGVMIFGGTESFFNDAPEAVNEESHGGCFEGVDLDRVYERVEPAYREDQPDLDGGFDAEELGMEGDDYDYGDFGDDFGDDTNDDIALGEDLTTVPEVRYYGGCNSRPVETVEPVDPAKGHISAIFGDTTAIPDPHAPAVELQPVEWSKGVLGSPAVDSTGHEFGPSSKVDYVQAVANLERQLTVATDQLGQTIDLLDRLTTATEKLKLRVDVVEAVVKSTNYGVWHRVADDMGVFGSHSVG